MKRIATEPASDACFLTCSEDGTVRQHDLRVGHACKRDCPPPLCDYRQLGMGLYSLSTSPLRPELFVVAGTSQYAYLHDRRMAPRTIYEQWGVPSNPRDLTQCVRRFGPPVPPDRAYEDEGKEEEEDDPGVALPPEMLAARTRARRARLRARRARSAENHVTAAKLSSHNGRELLLTYSGGGACLYDIFDEPEPPRGAMKYTDRVQHQKNTENELQGATFSEPRTPAEPSVRTTMRLTAPTGGVGAGAPPVATAAIPQRPEERSDFVASTSLVERAQSEAEPIDGDQTNESQDTFHPASGEASQSEAPSWRGFEIRVNDDGEIEVDVEEGNARRSAEGAEGADGVASEMNTDGFRQLLASTSAQTEAGNTANDAQSSSAASAMGEHGDGDEDEDDQDEEDDDSDSGSDDRGQDISSSDDPDAAYATSLDGHVPLVRPRREYVGHRNVDTVKDVNFGGADDSLVLSGSDDGNLFMYRKSDSELLAIIEADESVVNVMQWHPFLPLIAVSGIDNSVKLISPTARKEKMYSRLEKKQEITQKNGDASWTSEGLAIPHSALINLLSRAAGDEGEDGLPRRIPLSMLMQLAAQEEGEAGQDCIVM